jgi:hypothetical protein
MFDRSFSMFKITVTHYGSGTGLKDVAAGAVSIGLVKKGRKAGSDLSYA